MIERILARRLRKERKHHILLLGARQVGKSTLAKALHPGRYINLADESLFLEYAKVPALLRRELAALRAATLVVIDEVQRVPALLNMVQAMLDEGTAHRFLLTGSSARKLKRGGANLLPGRIILEHLDPLLYSEMGATFDLERVLRLGSLPGVYLNATRGGDLLDTYATVYLREEVQAEALTRDIGAYSRFVDIAAQMSGQWINYSKMASDAAIPIETIRRFFSLLEDTLLAFRVPSFQPRVNQRRVSQRDRYVLFDIGVRNALLGIHQRPISPVERGLLFEQWLLLQCLYYQRAHRCHWHIASYRTQAGAEVDIVIDTGREIVGIECKSGARISTVDPRGFRSLEEVVGQSIRRVVVYTGLRRQRFDDGTEIVPYGEFLTDTLAELH
ncbi:MAG: ATP-binding protein [Deltaproteobacteria bacterium]|nr:ATP-binding protein [Deltaproteobacteria bacterium]